MNIQDMWLQAQLQKQGGMPVPSNNPALLAAMQKHPAPHYDGDPLTEGAKAAMVAAREAISERPKSMMGGVLDSVGRTLQNLSIARLRGSHRAPTALFGNMMQTPGEMEENQYKKNKDMIDFLSKQAIFQEQAAHRKAALEEQKRYHNIIASKQTKKLGGKRESEASIPGIDLSKFPKMKTAGERRLYSNSLNSAGEAKALILRSLKNIKKLEKESEGNPIDPTGSMIPGANSVYNKLSRASEKGNKQFELRNMLNSDFSQLEMLLERVLKGASPDAQLIKRLHDEGVYPGLGQPLNLNKQKLEENLKKVEARMKADNLSLDTGHHIPRDMFENNEEEEVPEQLTHPAQQRNPLSNVSTEDLIAEYQKLKGGS